MGGGGGAFSHSCHPVRGAIPWRRRIAAFGVNAGCYFFFWIFFLDPDPSSRAFLAQTSVLQSRARR